MPTSPPITEYRLSDHALFEMARRQIAMSDIAKVLAAPEQTDPVRPGSALFQSLLEMGEPPKPYWRRVFVDIDREPPVG